MKLVPHYRILLLLVGWLLVGPRASAQGFGLTATTSTNQVIVSNSVSYTINLTNSTGFLLTNVFVTNTFSAVANLTSATNSQGSNSVISASLVFSLGTMTNGSSALMALTIQPTTPGYITNTIVVADTEVTNTATTNLTTQVLSAQADLQVTLAGPVQVVITNDWMTYQIMVTNAGPGAVPNVVLTNTLPPGVLVKTVSPSNQLATVTSSNLIFSLGTMANGGSASFQLTVQPTLSATNAPFSASVSAPDLLDTNLANNVASTNIPVLGYLAGTLMAVTNSGQAINWQNGLTEQSILLSNTGTNEVAAVRVVVTGLTNQLFNAVGTNSGSPFVYFSAPLATNQSVRLLLQYFPRTAQPFPFTNAQLHAYAVPLPNWTPPKAVSTSTNLNLSRIVKMSNGNMLIEFPSTLGSNYTVVYSDNVLFSNAQIAPPSVAAPANRTQWIDYGPPTTTNAPNNASARFYRVFQNP